MSTPAAAASILYCPYHLIISPVEISVAKVEAWTPEELLRRVRSLSEKFAHIDAAIETNLEGFHWKNFRSELKTARSAIEAFLKDQFSSTSSKQAALRMWAAVPKYETLLTEYDTLTKLRERISELGEEILQVKRNIPSKSSVQQNKALSKALNAAQRATLVVLQPSGCPQVGMVPAVQSLRVSVGAIIAGLKNTKAKLDQQEQFRQLSSQQYKQLKADFVGQQELWKQVHLESSEVSALCDHISGVIICRDLYVDAEKKLSELKATFPLKIRMAARLEEAETLEVNSSKLREGLEAFILNEKPDKAPVIVIESQVDGAVTQTPVDLGFLNLQLRQSFEDVMKVIEKAEADFGEILQRLKTFKIDGSKADLIQVRNQAIEELIASSQTLGLQTDGLKQDKQMIDPMLIALDIFALAAAYKAEMLTRNGRIDLDLSKQKEFFDGVDVPSAGRVMSPGAASSSAPSRGFMFQPKADNADQEVERLRSAVAKFAVLTPLNEKQEYLEKTEGTLAEVKVKVLNSLEDLKTYSQQHAMKSEVGSCQKLIARIISDFVALRKDVRSESIKNQYMIDMQKFMAMVFECAVDGQRLRALRKENKDGASLLAEVERNMQTIVSNLQKMNLIDQDLVNAEKCVPEQILAAAYTNLLAKILAASTSFQSDDLDAANASSQEIVGDEEDDVTDLDRFYGDLAARLERFWSGSASTLQGMTRELASFRRIREGASGHTYEATLGAHLLVDSAYSAATSAASGALSLVRGLLPSGDK